MVQAAKIAISNSWSKRTFKRETAVILLIFWAVLTLKLFFWSNEALIGALGTAYGTATTLVGMFVMGAFGLDALFKQSPLAQGK